MRLFQTIHPRDPRIRPLPYPFRGALTISNDIEYFTFPEFDVLLKYLNTRGATPLGRGLGLEITSSMFFYSVPATTFAYFDGPEPTAKPAAYSDRLNHYLRAGWIDTNHSFGDFDADHPFRRDHARCAYETLGELGVRLRVYTDHGGHHNLQNIGPGSPRYHHGDLSGSPYYHADLLQPNGVHYVWSDCDATMITEPAENRLPRSPRRLLARLRQGRTRTSERLLAPYTLQDGTTLQRFARLRATGTNAPNLSSLRHQLDQIDWPDFYGRHGVVALYQHLGVLDRVNGQCRPATIAEIRQRPEIYLAPFQFLQAESQAARLLILGTARLLDYVHCTETAQLQHDPATHTWEVALPQPPAHPAAALQGLTIYTDSALPVRVLCAGQHLPVVHNGPDETGQSSVTVPIQPLPNIWS